MAAWESEQFFNAAGFLPVHETFGRRGQVEARDDIARIAQLGLHFFARYVLHLVDDQLPLPLVLGRP